MVERWNELMAGYVLGDLDAEERQEWEEILRSHPELTNEIKELQQTVAFASEQAPAVEPPPELRASLLAAVRATPQENASPSLSIVPPPTAEVSVRPSATAQPASQSLASPQKGWWLGLGSLAAAALIALLIDDLRLRNQVQEAAEVIASLEQQLEEAEIAIATAPAPPRVFTLAGTVNRAEASGSITIAPEQQATIVTVQDLPALPAGQVYRIWGLVPDQPPLLYGQFETDADSRLLPQEIPLPPAADPAAVTQFLITAESVDALPRPRGTLVMQSLPAG